EGSAGLWPRLSGHSGEFHAHAETAARRAAEGQAAAAASGGASGDVQAETARATGGCPAMGQTALRQTGAVVLHPQDRAASRPGFEPHAEVRSVRGVGEDVA